MLYCRRIIFERLTWNFGSKDKALFWSDSWEGYKAIDNIHDFGATRILLELHRGPLLNNYISPLEDGAGWQWIEKEDEDIPVRDKQKLMAILKSRNIVLGQNKDKLI